MINLKTLQDLALARGGECLTQSIPQGVFPKIRFRCEKNHVWEATTTSILGGSWCAKCTGKHLISITDLQIAANELGGVCLSEKYEGKSTKLKWQCKESHEWFALPREILRGHWCQDCRFIKSRKKTYDECKKIVSKRHGKILSKSLTDSKRLLISCSQSHQWEPLVATLKKGAWCPTCAGLALGTIESMQLLARKNKGKCLSKVYINSTTHLEWECSNQHSWKATPHAVKSGTWCSECQGLSRGTIEKMQDLAAKNKGKCLSKSYQNNKTPLQWKCKEGHIFKAIPNSIISGSWCPSCGGSAPLTLSDAKAAAQNNQGKCLSSKYINSKTLLKWRCNQGHTWLATLHDVRGKRWCKICRYQENGQQRKLGIEAMKALARKRGGECLSSDYKDAKTHLLWRCADGHEWKSNAICVKYAKSWCPECSKNRKLQV